jgi:hypothetical protein
MNTPKRFRHPLTWLCCVLLTLPLGNTSLGGASAQTNSLLNNAIKITHYSPKKIRTKNTKDCTSPKVGISLWGNAVTKADVAHKQCITGAGVKMVVIDTGFFPGNMTSPYSYNKVDFRCNRYFSDLQKQKSCREFYEELKKNFPIKLNQISKKGLSEQEEKQIIQRIIALGMHGYYVSESALTIAPDMDLYLLAIGNALEDFDLTMTSLLQSVQLSLQYCQRIQCDIVNISFAIPPFVYFEARKKCEEEKDCALLGAMIEVRDRILIMGSKGVAFFISTGNHGAEKSFPTALQNTLFFPAIIEGDNINAIGSIDSKTQFSSFTPANPKIAFVCPGEKLIIPRRPLLTGTSFASPTCAGVYALHKQANPTTSTSEIIKIMKKCSVVAKVPAAVQKKLSGTDGNVTFRVPQAPGGCPKT